GQGGVSLLLVVRPQPGPVKSGQPTSQEAEPRAFKRKRRAIVDALCPLANPGIEGDHAADAPHGEGSDEELLWGNFTDLADFERGERDRLGVVPQGEPQIVEIAPEGRSDLLTADRWRKE